MKAFFRRNLIPIIFGAVEAVMFGLIFFSKLPTHKTSYISIALCFLYAVLCLFRPGKTTDRILLALGLAFTLGADTFLVLMSNGNKVLAMVLFFCAQTAYLARLAAMHKSKEISKANILSNAALVLAAALITVTAFKKYAEPLVIISLAYYAMLISNTVFAFISFKKAPLFAIGLLLFALCDLTIGLNIAGDYLAAPKDGLIDKMSSLHFNLPWVFYLPAQVLIALSSHIKTRV